MAFFFIVPNVISRQVVFIYSEYTSDLATFRSKCLATDLLILERDAVKSDLRLEVNIPLLRSSLFVLPFAEERFRQERA